MAESTNLKVKVQYVQLDASMFFTDEDFLMMDESQRGIYCSIVLFLYCKNGGIKIESNNVITLLQPDIQKLSMISGFKKSPASWQKNWVVIAKKFSIIDGYLTHKKVTEEINRVIEYKRAKSEAGKLGMRNRWGKTDEKPEIITENNSVITEPLLPITKVSKGKLSEDKISEEKTIKKIFTPPTIKEVTEYSISIGFKSLNAQHWIDFYTAKGWMIGKNKMKDWKAAVRTWQRKDDDYGKSGKSGNATGQYRGGNTTEAHSILR